jgi:hypothetical protein
MERKGKAMCLTLQDLLPDDEGSLLIDILDEKEGELPSWNDGVCGKADCPRRRRGGGKRIRVVNDGSHNRVFSCSGEEE